MVEPLGTVHCALFAHKGGSFGIRELRQSDSNTTVREMKLGGTVVISLILCFVSRNKAQVSLIFFSFFRVYTGIYVNANDIISSAYFLLNKILQPIPG